MIKNNFIKILDKVNLLLKNFDFEFKFFKLIIILFPFSTPSKMIQANFIFPNKLHCQAH